MKKANEKNVHHVARCLVESLAILADKKIIDGDIAINFINTDNLQGLQGYLEGTSLKVNKHREGE